VGVPRLDITHDPGLRSWVESANRQGADFPVQNLPFGVFRTEADGEARIGVAIGDQILDLRGAARAGLLSGVDAAAFEAEKDSLNGLMGLPPETRQALRARLSELLRLEKHRARAAPLLVPMSRATLLLPVRIGDYTDFYASIHHATRVGALFRPEQPLLPNYKHVPIGYHGRASSVVASGERVARPRGQILPADSTVPVFAPTRALDYELELGFYVARGNALGHPVAIDEAEACMFGFCLVNDWSARDIQRWEAQPLGPFLSKSFATSVSPWIVTLEALAPFRIPPAERSAGDPAPLPYLDSAANREQGGLDLHLEARLSSARMRAEGREASLVGGSNARYLYWTPAQMLAHHTSNGCNLRPGDLIATGTVSGPGEDACGCLLELTRGGAAPLRLPTGEKRAFLEDGDEVTLTGYCEREGFARIGFGECRGAVGQAPL
jgi:fumarylacetoacetase